MIPTNKNQGINQQITSLGKKIINTLIIFGRATLMLWAILFNRPNFRLNTPLVIQQIYSLGVKSLLIIIISGIFIGMALGLQGYAILVDFGSENNLGFVVALSLLRELGPVITALLFTGRACSALTAEIGLMKATEQLSALEMMAINPLKRIIIPRFWAGIISLPILTFIFITVAIVSSSFVGIHWQGVDEGSFWSIMNMGINWQKTIINCLIKSIIFSVITVWIALFNGYYCEPTAEGVGNATTTMVVCSSLLILIVNFSLTVLQY